MVLHFADDNVIARPHIAAAPAVRHQVNALRRTANKHQLFGGAGVNKQRSELAHILHFFRSLSAQRMDAAVDRRIAVTVELGFGINHLVRLLRAGRAIQIRQR